MNRLLAFLLLFLVPTPVLADTTELHLPFPWTEHNGGYAPDPYTVHEDAMATAMFCVCQTRDENHPCQQSVERRTRVQAALSIFVRLAEEYDLPFYARPLLAAVACGESGYNETPGCWADQECAHSCLEEQGLTKDTMTPKDWHECSTRCGGNSGCNDSGTSAGMFQIKWDGVLGKLARKNGFNLYDTESAGRFYLEQVLNAVDRDRGFDQAKRLDGDCGRLTGETRWWVALTRLARGPSVFRGGTTRVWDTRRQEVVTVTEPRLPRCTGDTKYAEWSARWAAANPNAWLPQRPLNVD